MRRPIRRRRAKDLSAVEVQRLIEHAKGDLGLKIQFAAETALRSREQWSLRWCDIDLDQACVLLSRSMRTHSIVSVPLSASLANRMASFRACTPFKSEADYVFANRAGRPQANRAIWSSFRKLGEELFPERDRKDRLPRWHDLRRYAVGTWAMAGLPRQTIAHRAGLTILPGDKLVLLGGMDEQQRD